MREFRQAGALLEEVYVGLDYATAFVQVCVLDAAGRVLVNTRCDNSWRALNDFVRRYGRSIRGAIEACTGAANLADELVQHGGWSLDLAHPGYVQRMKQSPDKTDFTDARMLADLVRVGYLPRVWLAPEAIRELRRLVRRRQDLVERRRILKLQIGAWLRDLRIAEPEGTRWTKKWRAWLKQVPLPAQTRWVVNSANAELVQVEKWIAATERRLASATRRDPMVKRLCAMRGLGLVTACVLRAEIGDATRFRTGKQLAHFCGLTPRNASSGTRQADAGLIKAGNRYLRATLMEAAHRLRRFDPRWSAFSAALEARGKKRCLVVAAVANRWVRGLFHELKAISRAA
jgi:transposase